MNRVERKLAVVERLDIEMRRLQRRWATLLKRKMKALRPVRRVGN